MVTHPHDSVLQSDWSRQIPGAKSQRLNSPMLSDSFLPCAGKRNWAWLWG